MGENVPPPRDVDSRDWTKSPNNNATTFQAQIEDIGRQPTIASTPSASTQPVKNASSRDTSAVFAMEQLATALPGEQRQQFPGFQPSGASLAGQWQAPYSYPQPPYQLSPQYHTQALAWQQRFANQSHPMAQNAYGVPAHATAMYPQRIDTLATEGTHFQSHPPGYHYGFEQATPPPPPLASWQAGVLSAHEPTVSGRPSFGADTQAAASSPDSGFPRGAPRKPRQSGHALWVGNLPRSVTVLELKDHFSRNLTKEIESVKLISKSHCAFVNYRTYEACQTAMSSFHESRIQGVRLVCRMRRSSISGSETVTPPGGTKPKSPTGAEVEVPDLESKAALQSEERRSERIFILKSLTPQDLIASTRTGIWTTQVHNESTLNAAYKNSDNVYLIFSANKMGDYFGFARMASQIPAPDLVGESSTKSVSIPESPLASSFSPLSLTGPKTYSTPATEWAPPGRVVDDSARGTIFWEAESSSEEPSSLISAEAAEPAVSVSSGYGSTPVSSENRSFDTEQSEQQLQPDQPGNLFRVEWISTRRVPFHRTHGLRNPWNANREVKIARDGTEVEPEVGKKLLALFGPPTSKPVS